MSKLSIPFGWKVQAIYEQAAIVAVHACAVIEDAATDFMHIVHYTVPGKEFAWPLTIQFQPVNPLSLGPTHLYWTIDAGGYVRVSSEGREVIRDARSRAILPTEQSLDITEQYIGTKQPVEPVELKETVREFEVFHAVDPKLMFRAIEQQPRKSIGAVIASNLDEAFRISQGFSKQWNHRSTSVGDIIVDTLDNTAHMVAGMGFKYIPDLDPSKVGSGETISHDSLEAYEAKLMEEFTKERLPEGGLKL